jgi:hypothetical protein
LRKEAETAKEHLLEELKDAIVKERALTVFIPVCSSCKKIRDDHCYWKQDYANN